MRFTVGLGFTIAAAVLSQGCGWRSMTHVYVDPLQTRFPVSASSHYLDKSGKVVSPTQYAPVKSFQIVRTVETPAHVTSAIPMQLEEELEQIVSKSGGDAVTNMTFQAQSYEAEGHFSTNRWKMLGLFGVIVGGSTLGLTAMVDNADNHMLEDSSFYPWYGVGVGGIALGLASFATASSRKKSIPNRWVIAVEGQVVKRNVESLPPPPRTPTPPLPASEPPAAAANPDGSQPADSPPTDVPPVPAAPSASPESSP